MFARNFVVRKLGGFAMMCAMSVAQAGFFVPPSGAIDYGPLATSVPTLGVWALLLVALLVAVLAYRVLRERVNGRLLSNVVLVGSAAAAGVAGHDLMQRAEAGGEINSVNLSSVSGGSVNGTDLTQAINTSGIPQQIKAIRPAKSVQVISAPTPQCQVGAVVQPGAQCNVQFVYPDTGTR